MTPICGRLARHGGRAGLVPVRAGLRPKWHGRHKPRHNPVPPFEADLLCKSAAWHGRHNGTTFPQTFGRCRKTYGICEIPTSQRDICKTAVPLCRPQTPRPHMGVSGGLLNDL